MIGILCLEEERAAVKEFFELFKTPWELYNERSSYDIFISTVNDPLEVDALLHIIFNPDRVTGDPETISPIPDSMEVHIDFGDRSLPLYGRSGTFPGVEKAFARIEDSGEAAGIEYSRSGNRVLRLGYNLFTEVSLLLSQGQPSKNASIPTLDLHISLLRTWILQAGIPLLEIPPSPAGHDFITCLTHDVDFVGIRNHKFNHTFAGFLYRALFGSLLRLLRGRLTVGQLFRNYFAVLTVPFVHLGIVRDFWSQFKGYMEIEGGLRSTFFILPFKGRPGSNVTMPNPERRAAMYDITEIQGSVKELVENGYEVGLHGIDAWHSGEMAMEEMERIQSVTGRPEKPGIRMHWLCFSLDSFEILDRAGFEYDSTIGYNDVAGYRAGTAQVFRPASSGHMLEIPFHIQDVAMFYPGALDLPEQKAWDLYSSIADHASRTGGVVAAIWHMRSIAPERLWDRFYIRMVNDLKSRNTWFASAYEAVGWFRVRRGVSFREVIVDDESLRVRLDMDPDTVTDKPLQLRVHIPRKMTSTQEEPVSTCVNIAWTGEERELTIPLRSPIKETD